MLHADSPTLVRMPSREGLAALLLPSAPRRRRSPQAWVVVGSISCPAAGETSMDPLFTTQYEICPRNPDTLFAVKRYDRLTGVDKVPA